MSIGETQDDLDGERPPSVSPMIPDAIPETDGDVDRSDSDEPKPIYVLTSDSEIWSFDPLAVKYELVMAVRCPRIEGDPTGFAIDRHGVVTLISAEPYVPDFGDSMPMKSTRFAIGGAACEEVFYGAIEDKGARLHCADVTLVPRGDGSDPPRLFAHSCTGGGFTQGPGIGSVFRLDLAGATAHVALLANTDYTSMPLAATGEGRLFGIAGDQDRAGSTRLFELDPDTGAIMASTAVPRISLGNEGFYQALAFHGGDFYSFGLDHVRGTVVYRYDWDDDDGNGKHEVTYIRGAADHPFSGGIIAATSVTR